MGAAPRAVVLLSGGLDSATALAIARAEGFRVHALTVRYGQRHAVEVERAGELARRLGAEEHRVVDLDLRWVGGSALTDPAIAVPSREADVGVGRGIPVTYVPARNTILLSLALAWAETLGASELFLGVNALDYSGYPDCRPEFLEAYQRVADLGTRRGVEGSGVRVRAPLLRMTKAEIIRRAVELGVDLGRTVSCYAPSGEGRPCGDCEACRLRVRGFREAGIPDPAGEH